MIKTYFRPLYKTYNNKFYLNLLFYLAAILFIILAFLRIFNSLGYFMDELEHIHASFLISKGFVPYRDFFEHHHPLIWYLLLPITIIFERDINIIYITRFIAVFGYFIFLLLFYQTAKMCSKSHTAKIAVLVLFCFYHLWRHIQTIRPDIFMYIFIFAALVSFFNYLNKQQTKYLCFSYMFWFTAFLFLQKACFSGIGFAIANFWLLYKNEIRLKDMIIAAVFPLFGLFILLALLINFNAFNDYWQYNFVYNKFIHAYYGSSVSGVGYLPFFSLILAIIIIRTFKPTKQNIVIFFCWLFSGMSLFYFAPYHQYYFLYTAFSILLLLPIFANLFHKYFLPFMMILTSLLCISFFINYNSYNTRHKLQDQINLVNFIMQHTSYEDQVSASSHAYHLFNKNTNYYWFGFKHAVIIADLFMDKKFDFNEQLKTNKPKFVILSNFDIDLIAYFHSKWLISRNTNIIQKAAKGDKQAFSKLSDINIDYWQIDMEYIKKYYRYLHTYDGMELWEKIEE